jgi:glucose dehydrogenase
MKTGFTVVSAVAVTFAAVAVITAAIRMETTEAECCAAATADWPHVAGTLAGQGYTGLSQIKPSNIDQLGLAWMVQLSAEPVTMPIAGPGDTTTAQQTTPIVIEGVMYLNVPGGGVAALDGATGELKWKWVPSEEANGFGPTFQQRGVSVGEGKVFTSAGGNRMVALDKDTGAIVWAVQPMAPDGSEF